MSTYFIPDSAFGEEAECPICACLWTDPVEIEGCQHILCRECVQHLKSCPSCSHPITKLNTPNHAILRMLMRVRGRCSSCSWKGTYKEFKENHKTCLRSGEGQSVAGAAVGASEEQKEAERMQDYFMEETPVSIVSSQSWSPQPSAAAPGGPLRNQVPAASGPAWTTASPSTTPALSYQEVHQWRRSLSATGGDYGLTSSEFSSLVEKFTDFASRSSNGTPALRWRGACRLLRFFNYPNHPDDVKNLFETAQQSPSSGSVSFHALCLWLALNQRNPQQWYGMNAADYTSILRVAQVLDEDMKGLFTIDQALLLAEQYFRRDLPKPEWEAISRVLRDKDETIRQYFQSTGNFSVLNRDFKGGSGDVRLPFHDILVTFRAHVEASKKLQGEREQDMRGAEYSQRIKRMIQHYEPAAIATIDNTIAKFKGEEAELLQTLIAMYGPEPTGS